jgi:hypothetical protein
MAWDPARRELPALRHWHPVAFAHELSDKPLAVHGYELRPYGRASPRSKIAARIAGRA